MSSKLEQKESNNDTRVNSAWFDTPNDWNCPVCKRHKSELIRPDNAGKPFASLEDHHDHISAFIKACADDIISKERSDRLVDEDEIRFLKHRLTPFLERFQRTLICGDCNAADAAAKDQLGDVCKYFSFSPREIRAFIETSPHRPHRVMYVDVKRVYSGLGQLHSERKALAKSWVQKALLEDQHWAEAKSGPSRSHYRTLCRSVKSFEENLADDWDTLWKGQDTNLGISQSERARLKEQRREARRLERKKLRQEKRAVKPDNQEPTPKKKTKTKPQNAGQPWSAELDRTLREKFENGGTIPLIAEEFQRTHGSIRSRLQKLGLIQE